MQVMIQLNLPFPLLSKKKKKKNALQGDILINPSFSLDFRKTLTPDSQL